MLLLHVRLLSHLVVVQPVHPAKCACLTVILRTLQVATYELFTVLLVVQSVVLCLKQFDDRLSR